MKNNSRDARHEPGPNGVVPLAYLVDIGNWKRAQRKGQVEEQEVHEGKPKRRASERMPTLPGLFVD